LPGQLPEVVVSLYDITGDGSQLSIAVAEPVAAGMLESSQLIVKSAGQAITGGVTS
jgi:hypothetical protein